MSTMRITAKEHGHQYVCKTIQGIANGEIRINEKLPPILKALRIETDYTFKIPHGNKVRTLILEEGICRIDGGEYVYEITIERW